MTATSAPPDGRDRTWRPTLATVVRASPALATLVLVTTTVVALVPAANVMAVAGVVDEVSRAVDGVAGSRLWWWVAGLAALGLLAQAGGAVQSYGENLLQTRVANSFGVMVMEKAARLGLADFEDAEVYDKLQRAVAESNSRPYMVFRDLVGLVTGGVAFASVSLVLVAWDPWVALAVVLAPVPAVVSEIVFARRLWAVENRRTEERRRLNYLLNLVTSDRAYKETRLLRVTGHFVERYRGALAGFLRVDGEVERQRLVATTAASVVGAAAVGAATVLAVRDALALGDVGRMAAYLTAMAGVSASALAFLGGIAQLAEHRIYLANLFAFLRLPEEEVSTADLPVPAPLRTGIEFRDVWFRYPGTDRDVLQGLSMSVPAGATVALVGENGAGKTTIVKLLTGMYRPTRGEILLDGRRVDEYGTAELRRAVSVLFQDYLQYELTARENIALGAIDTPWDDERAWRAAQGAQAESILAALPSGLDTQLGRWFAGGHQLSGGQWQRVALARALVGEAPVLVLDEPTAALDAQAEADVFARLAENENARTTLLIAHRFATVRTADRIVVLEQGRLLEEGDHESLMRLGGRYHALFRLQADAYLRTPAGGAPGAP
ncbi:ABC transporter ATP-binding protein [Cellulomonas sp. 179-A 9B4 NHS]|uniref:ABC transporter ATP-binding protein n=1 Tax=Cellulomonas sp. 179-A 9B4 NHS TaxID=3142379 RepID=UPI00399F76EA